MNYFISKYAKTTEMKKILFSVIYLFSILDHSQGLSPTLQQNPSNQAILFSEPKEHILNAAIKYTNNEFVDNFNNPWNKEPRNVNPVTPGVKKSETLLNFKKYNDAIIKNSRDTGAYFNRAIEKIQNK